MMSVAMYNKYMYICIINQLCKINTKNSHKAEFNKYVGPKL